MFSAILLVLVGAAVSWEKIPGSSEGPNPESLVGPAEESPDGRLEWGKGSVAAAIDMMYPDCVRKSCAPSLVECNKDSDNCGARLRCAFSRKGDDIGDCWKQMTWAKMTNAEVSMFDCAKQRECVNDDFAAQEAAGHQPASSWSSFLETEVHNRGLKRDYSAPDYTGEGESLLQESQKELAKAEGQEDEASEAEHDDEAEAMEEVLAGLSQGQMHEAIPLVANLAKHHLYMNSVESLLQVSQQELAKAEAGDNSEEQKKKVFKLLGALEAAMDGLGTHVEGLEASKAMLQHEAMRESDEEGDLEHHPDLAHGVEPTAEHDAALAELVANVVPHPTFENGMPQLRTVKPATQ